MNIVAPFDYAALTADDRTTMQDSAHRIRARLSGIKRNFIAIGEELVRVKERVPHGTFTAWVQAELHMTPRSAQNYMGAASLVRSMPEPARETVSLLPPTTLYKLAAPSTPKEVVAEVAQAAEAGTLPTNDAIIQRIAAATDEAREVKRVQKAKRGRTEADAKKLVAKRRADQARAQEEARQEYARERAERAAAEADLTAAVARLVAEHHDVMQAVAAAIADPRTQHLLYCVLCDALARKAVMA